MNTSAIPVFEDERIAAHQSIQIPGMQSEEALNNLAALASQICGAAAAAISLLHNGRMLLKARSGTAFPPLLLHPSFCFPVTDGVPVTENTLTDDRFYLYPQIAGEPHIRCFAAVPVVAANGAVAGQLAVYDDTERTLTDQQLAGLQLLAGQVAALLQLQALAEQCKEREQACSNSAHLQSAVFQNAIQAVVILDAEGTIVQWNPKAESLFGWNKEEAIGKSFRETVIAGHCRNEYAAHINAYGETGNEKELNKTIEIVSLRKDNSELYIELGVSPTAANGQLFYICYISDNTNHKLVTSKLDKQKEFYETILNKIPTDIAVFDPQHRYLFVNPCAIGDPELRKYIIGKDDFEYAVYRNRDAGIAEQRRKNFLEAVHTNKEVLLEDNIQDKAGNMITHLRRFFPVFDEEGRLKIVIGFGVDITERKKMEEKQSVLVKQLSAQNNQLTDFCNIVSHNLRAPLVNMSMLAKCIEESSDTDEQKTFISMLQPVIDNLQLTFNELVESIQIKQDIEIQSEDIYLADCLQRTLNGLELKIKECEAVIETDFEAAPAVYYPSKYLYSIIHNLITNAIKYHDPKRQPVIRLQTQKTDGKIVLSVADNGLGIDIVQHKDNIFKIGKVFHRHPNAKGFGLYMTKTQVEAMGGKIWVESSAGKGATFFIEFINQRK